MFVLIQLIMALLYNILCFPGSSQTSTHSDSHDTILYWPSWDHLRCASRQSGAPHAGATWAFLCILSHVIFYSSKFFFHVYLKERLKIYLGQWISFIWIHLYNPRYYIAMQVVQTLTDGVVPSQDLISSVKNLYSKMKVLYSSVPDLNFKFLLTFILSDCILPE
jgi:hypothetical protein